MGEHSADFGDFEATADSCSAPKSPKNYESPTAIPRILEEGIGLSVKNRPSRHCETCRKAGCGKAAASLVIHTNKDTKPRIHF